MVPLFLGSHCWMLLLGLLVGMPTLAEEESSLRTSTHWAFKPVLQPPVPDGANHPDANPIDRFVGKKLRETGLEFSREADRVALARRLWLVMLGVPPSPEEVEAFLTDTRSDAFERLVDKVLGDPRYGERWGRHWLDLVRFAESNGFETNRERPNAWRYRDYVIAAFNDDTPYDQFIREQIAGDVLGNDIATGFLVAGPVDIVGSPDPVLTAQQRADEIDDMVGTTGSAFLGLSLGCARCHNHKFDPIPQKEYYAVAAIYAGVRHGERPLKAQESKKAVVADLDDKIAKLEKNLARFIPPDSARGTTALRPPVQAASNTETFEPAIAKFVRFSILESSGGEPCIDELEIWSGERNVGLARAGAKATASGTLPGFEIHKLEHIHDGEHGNSRSWISNEPGRGWVRIELAEPARIDRVVWGRDRGGQFKDRIATRYRIEASRDGDAWRLLASSDDREPYASSPAKRAKYRFDGFAEADAAQGRAWEDELEKIRKERDVASRPPLAYAGKFVAPGPTHRLHRGDPMQKREEVAPGTLSVFDPRTMPRDEPEAQRRMRFAGWIASAENPLTARVFINRVWQQHFGAGLVNTPSDFGMNGSPPTHPELLDWLASRFVAEGWSLKKLQRAILLSNTWRQSSAPNPAASKVDAACRLLWRFPPRRVEAEAIRDSILSVSGRLDPRRGGPSFFLHDVDRENVYHYHPKETFGPEETRRMVYAFKVRMEQDGIFGAFDCPDGSLAVARRASSTTPLQALNLFNSRFMLEEASAFARRLTREAGQDNQARVRRAWKLAFSREPSGPEREEAVRLVSNHGWDSLGRALFNTSEFCFIP